MPVGEVIAEVIGGFFAEFIMQPILYVLLVLPGAIIRFIFFLPFPNRKKFTVYLKDDKFLNGIVTFFTVLVIVIIVSVVL